MSKKRFLSIYFLIVLFFVFSENPLYQQNISNIKTFIKTDFFPIISELSSKNPIFKQFSQEVELN